MSRSTPKFVLLLVGFHLIAGVVLTVVFYALRGSISAGALQFVGYAVLVPVVVGYYFALRAVIGRPHRYGRDIEP